jgi:23S rRNA pseudouridine955/2504/2580 synthase
MALVDQKTVEKDEHGMRLDRWFKVHYPGLGFGQLQKTLRSGQIRVDGGRARSDTRVQEGQTIRIPPNVAAIVNSAGHDPLTSNTIRHREDLDVLKSMTLYEDKKVIVFNKPAGLAVQGGSGLTRHVDRMLEAMTSQKGEKPRLVHRLDRDTSGVLVVAKTRGAAAALTKEFRGRKTDKTYWAILKGVPKPRQGRISNWLARQRDEEGDDYMAVVKHGTPDADHAVSEYRVIEASGPNLCWIEFKPVTGRTHQLRVHAQNLGNPIIGDPKYFNIENWALPGGIQNKLHLHARRIRIPHPDGGIIDVSAPLPPHMLQTFNLLGFDPDLVEDEEVILMPGNKKIKK